MCQGFRASPNFDGQNCSWLIATKKKKSSIVDPTQFRSDPYINSHITYTFNTHNIGTEFTNWRAIDTEYILLFYNDVEALLRPFLKVNYCAVWTRFGKLLSVESYYHLLFQHAMGSGGSRPIGCMRFEEPRCRCGWHLQFCVVPFFAFPWKVHGKWMVKQKCDINHEN